MKTNHSQLELAVETYKKGFKDSKINIFDISELDCVGLPIYVASLESSDGFINNGVGYGGSDIEAMVGAFGELSETYHVHQALKKALSCESVSFNEMVNKFGSDVIVNPLSLCLSAGYPYHHDLPLRWVSVKRFYDNADCWMPREAVAFGGFSFDLRSSQVELQCSKSAAKLFPPITCGLGAGLSVEQALCHGLLELLQRDGNCTNFRALDQGVDINLDVVKSLETRNTLSTLENLGFKIRAKLASTDFDLLNIYVLAETTVGSSPNSNFPIMLSACGEAVDPNREHALRKALHEFISSRSRKAFMHCDTSQYKKLIPSSYLDGVVKNVNPLFEEPKALFEMVNLISKSESEIFDLFKNTSFSSLKSIKFSSLPNLSENDNVNFKQNLNFLISKLSTHNIPVYYFDASPIEDNSPKVVRVIAPGLEGETMSYWRVGKRGAKRLLLNHSSIISQKQPQSQHLMIPMHQADCDELGGPVYFKVPDWERVVYGHYPLYREPSAHSVQKYLNQNGT